MGVRHVSHYIPRGHIYPLKDSRVSFSSLIANTSHLFMSGDLPPVLAMFDVQRAWWLTEPDCRKWEGPPYWGTKQLPSGPFRGFLLAPLARLQVPESLAGGSATIFKETSSSTRRTHGPSTQMVSQPTTRMESNPRYTLGLVTKMYVSERIISKMLNAWFSCEYRMDVCPLICEGSGKMVKLAQSAVPVPGYLEAFQKEREHNTSESDTEVLTVL